MAIAFHASSTQSGDISASVSSFAITKPTVSTGDVLICTIGINNGTTAATVNTPTGWTLIGTINSTKVRTYAFWALQSVSGLTFTVTGGVGAGSISWECLSFSGVDNTTPIDVTGTGSSNTGAPNITPNNYTTVTDNALPMWSITDWNANSTFTSTNFTVKPTSNNANCQASTGYRNTTFSPAGSYTSVQINDGASASGNILCVQQYALRPDAGGGTGYTRTVSDNLGLSDIESTITQSLRNITDNTGLNDTFSRLVPSLRVIADNLALSDAFSRLSPALRKSIDNLGLSDSELTTTFSNRINSDNLGLSDSESTNTTSSRIVSDNLGLSDSITRLVVSLRVLQDSIGLSDSIKTIAVYFRLLSDTIGIHDSVILATPGGHGYLLSLIDNLGVSDLELTQTNSLRSNTDTLALTDTGGLATGFVRSNTDNIGLSDSKLTNTSYSRSNQDNIGISDIKKTMSAMLRLLQDTLGTTDNVLRAISTLLKLADSLGLTDTSRATKVIPKIPTIFLTGAAQRNIGAVGNGQRNILGSGNAQRNVVLTGDAGSNS